MFRCPQPFLRSRGLRALGLVLTASLAVQVSAILARTLFERLGPLSVSALRFAVAAVLVSALIRPRLRGRPGAQWLAIVSFGASIAAMNVFLYLALSRLPFGIALTLEFLGPFAVAVCGCRRPRAALFPVLGFIGVVLIVRPSGAFGITGVIFGLIAAAGLAAYTVLAERASKDESGFDALALAFVVAAVLTSPLTIRALPSVNASDLAILAGCAALGVLIAYAADFLAVRMTSARTVAVMLSFDPVLAALLGFVLLGQALDSWTLAGIVLVALAGGASAAMAGRVAESGVRPQPLALSTAATMRPPAAEIVGHSAPRR